MIISRKEAEKRLKEIFDIDCFYDEQWEAIERLLKGERILFIQRTGFGKSLCFQFPATQFQGITIVFSPLIALMRDQVYNLCKKKIDAAYINSEQSEEDNDEVIKQALEGKIKILYIAPERQENSAWVEAVKKMKISMVVIDEAHTISTWGHDFRPAFRRIIDLVNLMPKDFPILATTATATKRVQEDIEKQIGGRLTTIRGSLARSNLYLQVIVVKSEEEKMIWLASNLNDLPGTGLIYTGRRVDTITYANWLRFVDINAVAYNAGLDAQARKEIEKNLMDNKYKCVVSTNALGMGIDKKDIRFIIHTQIPASPIHYYQEIGRAGRDGKPTRIILFYNETLSEDGKAEDLHLPIAFIENSRPLIAKYNQVIDLLKDEPLSEREIIKKANLKQNQVRIIKSDLMDQGIIKEVLYGNSKKFEYQYTAKVLDTTKFEALRKLKMEDLNSIRDYIYTKTPRMNFLCQFLDSNENIIYSNCDNTNMPKLMVDKNDTIIDKLNKYRETYFPLLDVATITTKQKTGIRVKTPFPEVIEISKDNTLIGAFDLEKIDLKNIPEQDRESIEEIIDKHIDTASRLTNGYAASYYGATNVGVALHRSKYEDNGDFPDFLLNRTLSLFKKKYAKIPFNLVLYVPPSASGDLVKNFSVKFAESIETPLSHDLIKTRKTNEQKIYQNSYNKKDNVKDAFDIREEIVKGKNILLIDDIFDSGATIKEIGSLLTKRGAKWIVPIVIAKTIGDIL